MPQTPCLVAVILQIKQKKRERERRGMLKGNRQSEALSCDEQKEELTRMRSLINMHQGENGRRS